MRIRDDGGVDKLEKVQFYFLGKIDQDQREHQDEWEREEGRAAETGCFEGERGICRSCLRGD